MSNLYIQYIGGKNAGQQASIFSGDLEGLRSLLHSLQAKESVLINIILPRGNELTVGIGATRSSVQYSGKEHAPPYLIAQEVIPVISNGEIEFDAGGTLTPVPINQTLPTDKAIRLILDIVRSEQLPEYVMWVEV